MSALEEFNTFLSKAGIRMENVNDVLLIRADALKAVEILRKGDRAILGGDAWLRRGEHISPAYANWYAEAAERESRGDYLRRSWDLSEVFIKDFRENLEGEPLFSIVVEKELSQLVHEARAEHDVRSSRKPRPDILATVQLYHTSDGGRNGPTPPGCLGAFSCSMT